MEQNSEKHRIKSDAIRALLEEGTSKEKVKTLEATRTLGYLETLKGN